MQHQPIPQLPDGFFLVDSLWLRIPGARQPSRVTEETISQAIAVNKIILQGWEDALLQYRAYRAEWADGVLANLDKLAEEVKRELGGME